MQLLYPGFLWGLLAIGIPIAIHLLQLRRPQRVLFTNTEFIREVELTTMRRRRLQELMVLLARVMAVLFLVLLFCQPFLASVNGAASRQLDQVTVLVDNSGSMQAPGQQQSLVAEAVAGASALGRSYGVGTHFTVLGQRATGLDRTAYLTAVNSLGTAAQQISWGSAGVRDALQNTQQGPLYVFSDFQKSEATRELGQRIRRQGKVVLVPQVARPAGNIYIDSLWLNDAFVRARTNIGLHIRLRNGGKQEIVDCPIKVLLGGRQVATFQASVAAGGASETTVQVQLPDGKLALGQVLTSDAPVVFDNSYYFTMQPAALIRVLEIGEEPATQQAYAREPLFAYSFARPQNLNYGDLRRANLVLLREVPQPDAGLRDALASVVRRGGSVVVVPPASPVGRASYHNLFRELGAGGEQWEAPSAGGLVRQEVAMPSLRDPFFKDVFGAQPQRVAMPQVTPLLRLGQGGTAILRLRDGGDYLTEFGSGAGRAYVFTAPFASAYSDFAAHALFVPTLYRLAMLSYRTDQQPAYRLTMPSVALTVPPTTGATAGDAASYRLVHDSLTYIPAQRMQGGQLHLTIPAEMTSPGFYKLTRQGQVVTTLAFNGAKRESELAAYSAAELRQLVGPNHPNVQVLEGGAQPEVMARYRAEQTGQPLWRYCLLVVLACLLAETLLVRFGRPRATGAATA